MSNLKIPDLNLFRGKRDIRAGQLTQLEEKGLKLLKMGKNKESIQNLQAELYLDNYRTNLKHFVSPTKYKDQAEKYLKENKATDQIYLRAMRLPSERRVCHNCFDQYVNVHKQCYCQIQHKIQPKYRFQSQYPEPQPIVLKKQVKQQYTEIRTAEYVLKGKQDLKKEPEINQNDSVFISSQAPSNEIGLNDSIKQENKSIVQTLSNRLMPDNSIFLRQMKKREDYLDNINMDVGESRALIDFNGLAQAKRQYVHKSHQILDKLNEIIRNYEN